VGYGLKMLGVSRAEIKTRVKEALAMVDLEGFEDRVAAAPYAVD
jgi:iron(III) transport system ATP-binding protein